MNLLRLLKGNSFSKPVSWSTCHQVFTLTNKKRITYKRRKMLFTKNLILKKRTKVVVGTFFQLSGATLEILVSLSTKKNSLSDHRIETRSKTFGKWLDIERPIQQVVTVNQSLQLFYHLYMQGQNRSVPPGLNEPQSCQIHPLLWFSLHT